jgi:hypothetical protein
LQGLGIQSNNTNQLAGLNAALLAVATAEPGTYFDGQGKTYRYDNTFYVPAGVTLENCVFDVSNVPAFVSGGGVGAESMRLAGSLGTPVSCSTALSLGVFQVTVASTAGWQVGDTLLFRGQTFSGAPTNSTLKFAADTANESFFARIQTIVSSTVVMLEQAYPSKYTISASGLNVYRPQMAKGNRFINVSIVRTPNDLLDARGLYADFCQDVVWEGGTCEGLSLRSRAWISCWGVQIRDTKVHHCAYAGFGYGDAILDGSQDFWITKSRYSDVRHGVTIGGSGGINRNIFVLNNVVRGARKAGIDAHPSCDTFRFEGNDIEVANRWQNIDGHTEGVVAQGANARIINNVIRGIRGTPGGLGLDSAGILAQPSTTQKDEQYEISGNLIDSLSGTGARGIFLQNLKGNWLSPSSSSNGEMTYSVDNNTVDTVDGGGTRSSEGILIKGDAAGYGMRRGSVSNNHVYSRSTCLTILTESTNFILQTSIVGNTFAMINTDKPVVMISSATSNNISRVVVVGNTITGGSWGVRNSQADRVLLEGNIIGGWATAATLGTFSNNNILS